MKTCLTSFFIKEIQVDIAQYHFTAPRIVIMKTTVLVLMTTVLQKISKVFVSCVEEPIAGHMVAIGVY
jgi:hypothetical protein